MVVGNLHFVVLPLSSRSPVLRLQKWKGRRRGTGKQTTQIDITPRKKHPPLQQVQDQMPVLLLPLVIKQKR